MSRQDELYRRLLEAGMLVLRQAVAARDWEWVEAEVALLHNLPSLIGETNLERRRYFWTTELEAYLEFVNSPGRERAKSRMKTYYEPIWAEAVEPQGAST